MSTNPEARAWVEVRGDALRENYVRVRDRAGPDARVLPMVKADAYGLGITGAVNAIEPLGPWGYGVATVDEGVALRRLGVERRVIVISPQADVQLDEAIEAELDLSISTVEALDAAARVAARRGTRVRVHIDVDTGMGRSGFDWRSATAWAPCVREASGGAVEWVGIHTHLHSADEGEASVREQWARLGTALDVFGELPPGLLVHVLNSAGVFRTPEHAAALVRTGIFLYGGGVGHDQPIPEEVVSVRARVVHVRDADAGTTLGYGATYRARGEERWATLSIGYGDGFPRALGNRGSAVVGGRKVPIIGRISMDVTVVDISDAPGVAPGDVATVIGSDGEQTISLDDVAREAGTISYEVLTGLTARLPRIWKGVDG